MATSTTAAEHQAAQAALVTLLLQDLARAWASLDIDNLRDTLPVFIDTIAALIGYYGAASASIAADYYEDQRREAGITTPFRVTPTDPAGFDQIDAEIRWATKGLWSRDPDLESARTLVAGVTERAVLNAGRETSLDAVELDTDAVAWYRQTEADPCYFCALLAARGAVYTSRRAAEANRLDAFKPHDACRCQVVPVFGKYEPSPQVKQWQEMYRNATAGKNDKLLLWRRAYEGRTVS